MVGSRMGKPHWTAGRRSSRFSSQLYDYYINCTVYDKDFKLLNNDKNSIKKYISHEVTKRLQDNPNVYFITPLSQNRYIYADVLPFSEKKSRSDIPIYIIQGNLPQRNVKNRREYKMLCKILDKSYKYDFIIKIIGRGELPKELIKYKNKIKFKKNLQFIDFHREFLDGYCILPLISKETHPEYYKKKLTSSISYSLGYKLKCIIDEDLQKIYKLDNAEVYKDSNDIVNCFNKTLEDFYKKSESEPKSKSKSEPISESNSESKPESK